MGIPGVSPQDCAASTATSSPPSASSPAACPGCGCRRPADRRGQPKPGSASAPPSKARAFDWPVSRLTVNLAPADTKKAGTAYDLPILLSILAAAGEIDAPPDNALFFGELSLTGELRPVCGALSMALAARDAGFKTVFVPAMNAAEASLCFRCDGVSDPYIK